MSDVVVQAASVTHGSTLAVDDVTLTIGSGELVAVLGPSGCGKTSLLLALAGLLTLGIDPVIRRFEDTFADPVDAFSTRADLLRDTAAMVTAFPLLGAGLGTYWVAFPAFDSSTRGGTAEHAENQYIETFAELGLLGGLFAFAFVGAGAVINKDVPDYALMVGVPARQIGWMSAYGEQLDLPLTGSGETTCSHTGDRYTLNGTTVTRSPS